MGEPGLRRVWLALVAVLALGVLPGAAQADNSGGQRICEGPYALCSSAQCQPVAGDPTRVDCACEGPFNGLNIGNSSCAARIQGLTSTFSLVDPTATKTKSAKPSLACTGDNANRWAFCLDAPCSVVDGKASCQCTLNPVSDYYTFTNACPTDGAALKQACGQIWSAASQTELVSGFSQLSPFYGNPPVIAYCPVPSK